MDSDEMESGPLDDIRNAKKAVSEAKNQIEERIGRHRSLYGQLDYVEYYLGEQEQMLAFGAPIPPLYASSAAGIAYSGSRISTEIDQMLAAEERVLGGIENRVQLLASSVTGTLYLLSLQTTQAISFTGPRASVEIDWEALRQRVVTITSELEDMVMGARAALDSSSPESVRQACHSLRDCLTHVLNVLAPLDKVKQAAWFVEDTNSRSGVTRIQRLYYIALGKNADTATLAQLQELDVELLANAIAVNNEIIENSHKFKASSAESIRPVISGFCSNLVAIIDIHRTNCA